MTYKQYTLSVISILTLFSASCIAMENRLENAEVNSSISLLQYETFKRLNIEELEETKGKMGPVITGVIGGFGGAATSIAADVSANRPINWTGAGISAGAGFVMGASGNVLGGISGGMAGVALGTSAYGGLNAAFGGGSGGCSSCHSIYR
ncbi:hypothetical protein [Serratia fonticola]|uniref:hypothetical protein n=1 Tax=Serratia fonticola TaxID=47917 RepID=UPI00192CFD5F|nr:hypothetical protein [Serratia fonticola]MBL5828635.1 hypothetical protein [Serratia fonticola]